MKRINHILSLIILIGFGCDDFLDTELEGVATQDNVFNSVEGAINMSTGLYENMRAFYNNTYYNLYEIPMDDAFTRRDDRPLENFAFAPSIGSVRSLWNSHYQGIGRANFIITKIDDVSFREDQEELKNMIMGQARFFRAFYYFNLVRSFGNVPIYTGIVETPDGAFNQRESIVTVYEEQIEPDLLAAIDLLPDKTALGNTQGFEAGRVTREVAQTLLAWVYLTEEKWALSHQMAANVIGAYSLTPVYADLFGGRELLNDESMLEVQNILLDAGTILPRLGAPGPVLPSPSGIFAELIATDDDITWLPGKPASGNGLVQVFDPGDLRRDVSVSKYGLTESDLAPGQPSEFYSFKFWNDDPVNAGRAGVNFPVIRYADVLLIYAEAKNEDMALDADALEKLNMIRRRALGVDINTPDPAVDLTPATQEEFRLAVWKERRAEFCFEGKRFFDVNRRGTMIETMALQGVTVPAGAVVPNPASPSGKRQFLMPIPERELQINPDLGQNDGY